MTKALDINNPPEEPIEEDGRIETESDQPLANMNDEPTANR